MTQSDPRLTTSVLCYGTEEGPPQRVALRAGPLTMLYEDGDLRYIRAGGREIIRRIYAAVRDHNWGTVPGRLSRIELDVRDDSFAISYDVEHRQNAIDFRWKARIDGDRDGRVRFSMDGEAHSTFLRNRIGFCVLHPSGSAGADCMVEHVDGTTEQTSLPLPIIADQPVLPFNEVRAITQHVDSEIAVEIRFEGDTFEMEDQRNWSDASFKTFCTPLRLPYPVEVAAGTPIQQTVTVTLHGGKGATEQETAAEDIAFVLGTETHPLPRLGLCCATHGQTLSQVELERLRALRLDHLRVDLALADPQWETVLRRADEDARALDLPLEVALLLPEEYDEPLGSLREALAALRPRVCAWLVFPASESLRRTPPTAQLVAGARSYLAAYDPDVPFGAGTNSDFIFLNRFEPPIEQLDLVTFSINPQVHAFDHASLVETTAVQAVLVENTRALANGLPVMVSPVTLKPRFNPYASGPPAAQRADELPPDVDPRQMSLFGAGWTAASFKYLAQSGAASVTYGETTGWRGVMERADGSPLPEQFRSVPGAVFPMYHIFADIAECPDAMLLSATSVDPLRVDGFALRDGERARVVVANLTGEPQTVKVVGLGLEAKVSMLDTTTAAEAMREPERVRAREPRVIPTEVGSLRLNLAPCAIARIDTQLAERTPATDASSD